MFPQCVIMFLLFLSVNLTPVTNERRHIIERVRNDLRQFDTTPRLRMAIPELENSNKVGFGYNLLSGSPVCYTGECQMAGFTRSIFKLNYSSTVPGSCTNKLVPNNVELDCLPSTSTNVGSEVIDTVEHLHKSISNKLQVSIEAKFKGVEFSYKYSKETRYMLDNIVKNHQTSIFTKVQISYAKLSMFEPKMELSDNFKYVIENMPCCEEDDLDIEEYVKDFIFDYFGFTYVKAILLGGIAQQNIFIDRQATERLEQHGVQTTHEAAVSFNAVKYGAGISTSNTNSQNNAKHDMFMKEVRSIRATTLGGDVHLTSLEQWSKTVPNNPVIVEFAVQDIFRLLTKRYFSQDLLITNKSKLIEKILEKYITDSPYCYNNCGGNGVRGTCVSTGRFQFGICQCKPGWTGLDCETIEPPKILHGTICGFDRSLMRVNCGGLRPWEGCPKGWSKSSYSWGVDLTVCYKNQTEVGDPVHGTLCGLHSYQDKPYRFSHDIGCNITKDLVNEACPLGYQRYNSGVSSLTLGSERYIRRNAMCAITDGKEHLSGTLCGIQIEGTIRGPSCDGYNPGLRQCPSEYAVQYTAFNGLGYLVCVKK